MPRRHHLLPLLTLAVAVAGCAFMGGKSRAAEEAVTLHISNQNFHDATLFATWETQTVRLGTVTGNASGTFTFRWHPQQLRIRIQLLAVGEYLTEPMLVEPGDELELFIEHDLHRRIQRRRG